ncbi:MAG TPA: hypothetical protein VMG58_06595, partial [Candidatus Sulfotelmatobacter sp.]|nr:hypothetical protein [Candidatus Sulfotelmatobacter sp.]
MPRRSRPDGVAFDGHPVRDTMPRAPAPSGTRDRVRRVLTRRSGVVTSGSLLERESTLGVLLMLPGALLLMVFMAYPFFLGVWLSLSDSVIGRMGHFI